MRQWPSEFQETLVPYLSISDKRPLEPDAPLTDYGFDSLAQVGLMIELETRFAFSFPEDRVSPQTFYSADSLWAVVAECTAGNTV